MKIYCCFFWLSFGCFAQDLGVKSQKMSIDFLCGKKEENSVIAEESKGPKVFNKSDITENSLKKYMFLQAYDTVKIKIDELIYRASLGVWSFDNLNSFDVAMLCKIDLDLGTHYFQFDAQYQNVLSRLIALNELYKPEPVAKSERKIDCSIKEIICLAYSQLLFILKNGASTNIKDLWYLRNSDIRVVQNLPYAFQNAPSVEHLKIAGELYERLNGYHFKGDVAKAGAKRTFEEMKAFMPLDEECEKQSDAGRLIRSKNGKVSALCNIPQGYLSSFQL